MNLSPEFTISEAERCLRDANSSLTEIALRIPTNAHIGAMGAEVAVAQMIVSWASHQDTSRLRTYLRGGHDLTQADRLLRRLYGMVASLMCTEIRNVEGESIHEFLYERALTRLDEVQGLGSLGYTRGTGFELLCADHIARGSPPFFYRDSPGYLPKLRNREEFVSIGHAIINRTIGRSSSRAFISPDGVTAIANFIYEIFLNTEDHALTDLEGNLLKRSVRGIQTRHHRIDRHTVEKLVSGYPPLADFYRRLAAGIEEQSPVDLFEISIFDSGIGYAQSWTRAPLSELSLPAEKDAVLACFEKNATTKTHKGFGQGLPDVMRRLKQRKGFFRLRTGRISLYLDMQESKVSEHTPDFRFWAPPGIDLAPTRGSLITILVPLAKN